MEDVKKADDVTEITFNLTRAFSYGKEGNLTEAQFITLKAPSSRNMTQISFLKQAFYRALPKGSSDDDHPEKETDKEEVNAEDIMDIITSSPDVELSTVLVTARELFVAKDIALVDGETKLTKVLIDLMHPDDYFDMVGVYLKNFILASVVRKMNARLSPKSST